MLVLLMRHGDAVEPIPGIDDAHRWLTVHGRARVRDAGLAMLERNVALNHVFSSPKVRAVQTAELVAQGTGAWIEVGIHPGLAEDRPVEALAPLEGCGRGHAVLFVGHMPLIAAMSLHLAGSPAPPEVKRPFPPSMVHAYELHEGEPATLAWILDPRLCSPAYG